MILHRVDFLFNNRKLKKVSMTNLTVASYIAIALLVDIVILIFWFAFPNQRPKAVDIENTYPSVFYRVSDRHCNTGLSSVFEKIILAEKCCLLLFAIWKVSWKVEQRPVSILLTHISTSHSLFHFSVQAMMNIISNLN